MNGELEHCASDSHQSWSEVFPAHFSCLPLSVPY